MSFLSQLQRIGTSAEKCLFAVAVFSLVICETENQVEQQQYDFSWEKAVHIFVNVQITAFVELLS